MTLKSLSHFDRTQRSLAVLADDKHSRLAFRVESHAILRYEQRVRIVPLTNVRADKHPRQQETVWIGKTGAHMQRARVKVNHRVGKLERSGMRIPAAVFKREIHPNCTGAIRLYIGAWRDIRTTDLSANRRMNARITEIDLRRLDGRLRGGDFRRRLIARGDGIVIFLPAHRAGSYKRRITFSLRARAG